MTSSGTGRIFIPADKVGRSCVLSLLVLLLDWSKLDGQDPHVAINRRSAGDPQVISLQLRHFSIGPLVNPTNRREAAAS